MTTPTIIDRVRQAFADAFILLDEDVVFDEELAFDSIGGLDSVSRVRLFMTIEEDFDISISPREGSRLKTIGDLTKLIDAKQQTNR